MRFRSVWVAGAAILAAACSPVDAPRQAEPVAAGAVVGYPSPRTEFTVVADPDIGNVTFRGVVNGRTPAVVVAPNDGRVLEVFVTSGDLITEDGVVLSFRPAPSEAELIDLEIAELTIARAIARGADPALVADAEQARDDLIASYTDRVVPIASPATGVLRGTRQNVEYAVRQDQALFEVANPSDLVVDVALRNDEAALATVGTTVAMTRAGNDAEILTGTIAAITESVADGDSPDLIMTVELDDPTGVTLGDRLSVSLAAAIGAESVWIPRDAVGRQDGSPYILVSDEDGQLERRQIVLGRQTLSHVQIMSSLQVGVVLVAPE